MPQNKKLVALKTIAIERATEHGHKLSPFKNLYHNKGQRVARCHICNAFVSIRAFRNRDTHSDYTHIWGDALTISCVDIQARNIRLAAGREQAVAFLESHA